MRNIAPYISLFKSFPRVIRKKLPELMVPEGGDETGLPFLYSVFRKGSFFVEGLTGVDSHRFFHKKLPLELSKK